MTSSPMNSTALADELGAQLVDRGALVGGHHRQLDDLLALGDGDAVPGGRPAADRLDGGGGDLRVDPAGVHRDAGRLAFQPYARVVRGDLAQRVAQPGRGPRPAPGRAARRSRCRTRSRGCRRGAPRWAAGRARPGRAAPGRRPPRRWSAAARPARGRRPPTRAAARPCSGPRRSARGCRRSRRRPGAGGPGRSGRWRRAAPGPSIAGGVACWPRRRASFTSASVSGTPSSVRKDLAQCPTSWVRR